ncbi:alpha/beta hydrolase family protein [Neolewinella xylanilytica]|uniref:Alpha/beta hydrolase family protein n=1 Tax=Neolewinella xylanilytica TaxID=1514080 RepID=A0A2S6IAS1_9BACT|nr:alpha/beta hydrolase [Neolewinella xylanilytica]PPK88607.1 alpha/beta hydrolase family protein [Neolewinella xylanilytica]
MRIALFFLTPIFFLGGLPGMHLGSCALAQATYTTLENVNYRPDSADAYVRERCVLDLYYPQDSAGFATVVFFHGGGLSAGDKFIPEQWREQGIAVATANYRLHPRVQNPTYIRDAAAAVAWVMEHIAEYGGDPTRIYVSGHSAGGYLTSMIGLDTTYLAAFGKHPDSLAALIPFSGHTITHFTVRQERGLEWNDVVVDRYAPIRHLRPGAPPILLITGDRERELFGRYEENAYFWRMLRLSGHEENWLYEMQGFDHGGMARPASILTLDFIRGNLD